MLRRDFWVPFAAIPAAFSAVGATNRTYTGDPLRLVVEDLLDHPFYWWPRTLLSYPIVLRGPVALERLTLTRVDTGERVPVQFSGVEKDRAVLHFFSDLPAGGRREFVLRAGAAGTVAAQVKETREGRTIVLDSGSVRVRIPASQAGPFGGGAPGPVMQVSQGAGEWVGDSRLTLSDGQVARITTRRVESGPLFVAYEIVYESAGGSRYTARIQCNGGMEFVRVQEDMAGLRTGVTGSIASTWTGFAVSHRQAPNHPVPLVPRIGRYEDYPWERIDDPWHGRDLTLGSSRPIYFESPPPGELPFCLGIFQSWPAYHVGTSANFRAEKTGDALGIFIDKAEEWRDGEYAYEVESTALQVRFHYDGGRFWWQWPLIAGGRRSTGLAYYDSARDREAMEEFARAAEGVERGGVRYQVGRAYTSHTMFLQNRYGTIDLNVVKDWVLTYPSEARQAPAILTAGMVQDPAEMEKRVMSSGYVNTLPIFGTRENGGSGPTPGRNIVNFSPVPSRQMLAAWVGGYVSSRAAMSERQRRRVTAMLLFLGYVHMGDDYMPVTPMLGGHPNFLADVKAGVAMMAFLFPEHPMAATWADHWEKCMELNARFHTRPAVQAWDASGGRWTENLGTYVWAFLRPTLRTAFLLREYDGVERFVSPQVAELAEWLTQALSAPFAGETEEGYRALKAFDGGREWGVVGPGEGPRRVYPPQGAHAERRMAPASLWHLGHGLRRYAPLAAEHAMWAARPGNPETETAPNAPKTWAKMYDVAADNTGTNPHLRSRKFTGYGVVLRGAVDTAEEVSIHLQQIDESPNYRWGRTGEGGCGVLYYFAAGKGYSMNGPEDTGDRLSQDTDFCTNFGVYKEGKYRGIGMNAVSRPMYDLGMGQFAEIVPRVGPGSYSAPEYVSRSVLLAGHEYFVLYDAVSDPSIRQRLSWFVRRGEELPFLKRLRGGTARQQTKLETELTHGVWMDGTGDSMAVVSHRKDVVAEAAAFGARVRVGRDIADLVFRSAETVTFKAEGAEFEGTAGLIRKRVGSGETEFALFKGRRIGAGGIVFETGETGLGIGGVSGGGRAARGVFYAPKAGVARVRGMERGTFYVDGAARAGRREAGALVIELEQGRHQWEWTEGLPTPVAPTVLRTENRAGGARVIVGEVAGATRYRLELSEDGGRSWRAVPAMEISGLAEGRKVHVRAVAGNAERESEPGAEYPIYVSGQRPAPPDGVRVALAAGAATVTWGEVLGVSEYRLYARGQGGEFRVAYRGLERRFVDRRAGIRACDATPGGTGAAGDVVVYFVTTVNGNGESEASRKADTDPRSWRNWDPKPGEPFRRVFSSEPVYPRAAQPGPRYYPD